MMEVAERHVMPVTRLAEHHDGLEDVELPGGPAAPEPVPVQGDELVAATDDGCHGPLVHMDRDALPAPEPLGGPVGGDQIPVRAVILSDRPDVQLRGQAGTEGEEAVEQVHRLDELAVALQVLATVLP